LSAGTATPGARPAELKLATWNLEWFMKPETLRALTPDCLPADAPQDGARRAVPCDVAHELARSEEDIAALRRHAHELDADVIALQEVGRRRCGAADLPRLRLLLLGPRRRCRTTASPSGHGLPHQMRPGCSTDLSLADDVRRGSSSCAVSGTPGELRHCCPCT
jgi:hypothetical protein